MPARVETKLANQRTYADLKVVGKVEETYKI